MEVQELKSKIRTFGDFPGLWALMDWVFVFILAGSVISALCFIDWMLKLPICKLLIINPIYMSTSTFFGRFYRFLTIPNKLINIEVQNIHIIVAINLEIRFIS